MQNTLSAILPTISRSVSYNYLFCQKYFVYRHLSSIVACRTLASAQALCADLPSTTGISLDVGNTELLEAAVAEHDLVISLIPYTYHAAVIKAAIKGKTNVVTTSYVSPAMRELDAEAKAAGIIVMNEIGLDPGIDHLYAVKTIGEVHAKGGKVRNSMITFGHDETTPAIGQTIHFLLRWASGARVFGQSSRIQVLLVFSGCTPSTA